MPAPSPLPLSNSQAQFAASLCPAQLEDAKFCHPHPPAWGAALGWVNPARWHRMSACTEFYPVGPCLGNAPKYWCISQALPVQTSVICTFWITWIYLREMSACSRLVGLHVVSEGLIRAVIPVREVGKIQTDSLRSPQDKERFLQTPFPWSSQFDVAPHHGRSEHCSAFADRNSNKPLPFLPSLFTGKIFWLVWRLGFIFFSVSV